MAVREILMIGNEFLTRKALCVDFANDPVDRYMEDLRDTLYHVQRTKKIGRAIAGPQIGFQKRVIYMEAGGKRIVMINPEITTKSKEIFEVWDSCFSADVAFFGKTLRHKSITIRYTDEHQNEIREEFVDDLSELFQHELDHLEGVLFTDRIINNQIIMRSEWERL